MFTIFLLHENCFVTVTTLHRDDGVSTRCSRFLVSITGRRRPLCDIHILTVPNKGTINIARVIPSLDDHLPGIGAEFPLRRRIDGWWWTIQKSGFFVSRLRNERSG